MEVANKACANVSAALNFKPIKKMSFMPIALSCLFLFNAFINIIDIFPDFIGYIILCASLVRLAYLNTEIEASIKLFRYMIFVDISKYAVLALIFGITFGDEQNSAILLATFVYAVIEVIILVMAFGKMFNGFNGLGYIHENTSILGSKKPNARSYTEKIKSATMTFIVLRAAFSVLPELSVLTASEYIEGSFVMYLYEYIGTMRALAFVFASIFGIVWVSKMFRYCKRVSADKVFCDSLLKKFNADIVPNEAIFVKRQMSVIATMLAFCAAFMIDLRFDGISLVPDVLAAIFFVLAIAAAKKLVKVKTVIVALVTLFYVVATAARMVVEYNFFDEYYLGAVYRSPEVYNAYSVMCAVSIVTVVAQLMLAVCILLVLYRIIDRYTGFSIGEDKERAKAKLDALHKELKKKMITLILGSVAFVASEIFFIFGTVSYGFADEIAFIGSLLFMLSIIKSIADVREEIDAKYILQ